MKKVLTSEKKWFIIYSIVDNQREEIPMNNIILNNGHIARNEYRKDKSYKYLNNVRVNKKCMYNEPIEKFISFSINRSLLPLYKSKLDSQRMSTYIQEKKDAMNYLLLDVPLLMVDALFGKDLKIDKIDYIFDLYVEGTCDKYEVEDIEVVEYWRKELNNIFYKEIEDNAEYKVYDKELLKQSSVKKGNIRNEYMLITEFKNIDDDDILTKNQVKDDVYNIKEYIFNVLNIPFIDDYFNTRDLDKNYFIKKSMEHIENYIESEYNIENINIT